MLYSIMWGEGDGGRGGGGTGKKQANPYWEGDR